MTPTTAETHTVASTENDVVTAVQQVLRSSSEPLTLSKIRAQLPSQFRQSSLEELAETLRRQVAANVLYQYPKYRSQQDRFWDRPMTVHIATLLREQLEAGPLALSDLRRKLPTYAVAQAETVLLEQFAQGLLYRHPRSGKRGGDRFGLQPADPKEYLRPQLAVVFQSLQGLGFNETQLRAGALEILHDEEWSPAAELAAAEASARQARQQSESAAEPESATTTTTQAAPTEAQSQAQLSESIENRQ